MACAGFLLSDRPKTKGNMEQFFDGNLCRCTGYRPIIQSFMKLLNRDKEGCTGSCETCTACDHDQEHHVCESTDTSKGVCCGGSRSSNIIDIEDLVPLKKKEMTAAKIENTLILSDERTDFYQPKNLSSCIDLFFQLLKKGTPKEDISVNAGHTGKGGVEKYYNGTAPYHRPLETKVIVDVNFVPELRTITTSGSITTVWSGVTLNELIEFFASVNYAPFQAAKRHISVVANNQVRSAGTWAGNLVMAQKFPDFPSDIFLTLTALDARVSFLTFEGDIVGNVPIQNFCKQGGR